jgi:riboflavin synthase
VMLIPHTRENTTLGRKKPGAAVNLEFDLIAKHVQKLFQKLSITT